MNGIIAYGAYVPYHRLDRSLIAAALKVGGGRGSRSVASFDEDTTSLGVEAARNALKSTEVTVEGVTFSTAMPSYLDKTNATAIHAGLNLAGSVWAMDAVGSARSAFLAMVQACRSDATTLAVASDIRTGLPGSAEESGGGDGAAAFVCGSDSGAPVIAELIGSGSATSEFLDRWRTPGESRSRIWEERFGEQAYLRLVGDAFPAALASAGLEISDLTRLIVTGLQARAVRSAIRLIGTPAECVADDLDSTVGNTGAAHGPLLLASALDEAEPGDVIAVAVLADGCDVALFRVTDAMADYTPHATVVAQIKRGSLDLDYATFLTWRGMLDREPPRRPDPGRPAGPPSLRGESWKFGFVGSRDRSSGAIHLPPRRVSMDGGAVDDMDPVPMADVPATIATFTIDRLAFSLSPPMVAAVIDFDGGGRFQAELTDVDPDTVAIGDRVEMTFRRLFTADGVHNYFWKARPIR